MKKLVLSLSLVLAFSSATVAFAAIPQNIRIGTDPTYAPFESKNSQGELVGFDIDLAKELCKRINTQCTFVENPLDALIPSLKAKKIDAIMSSLSITEKRPDGYHNLETIFYPLPIEDALEVNVWNKGTGKFRLHQSGLEIIGETENNLVVKAYKMLDEEFNLPPVDIYLFKHIPSGAGLGGGSADAAFMLKLLNKKFCLNLTDEVLEEYAARLGADCAFFIKNKPTYAEGIGNRFSPISF